MVLDGFQSNLGATTQITLAANAPLGEHLLRIKSGDVQNTTQDPCMDMNYGETEDYKVNLTSAALITDIEFGQAAKIVLGTPVSSLSSSILFKT
jgi:hypothetical protein